jgi:hypothetical protein
LPTSGDRLPLPTCRGVPRPVTARPIGRMRGDREAW